MKKTKVLKIDKDLFISEDWLNNYCKTIIFTCKLHGVTVESIKTTESEKKGLHFYITISPKITAHKAVYLQFLLGDDSSRVDYCRARVDSQLEGWNQLFWVLGRRLRTVYKRTKTTVQKSKRVCS